MRSYHAMITGAAMAIGSIIAMEKYGSDGKMFVWTLVGGILIFTVGCLWSAGDRH